MKTEWDRANGRQGHLQLLRPLQHLLRRVQQQHILYAGAPPSQPPHHVLTCQVTQLMLLLLSQKPQDERRMTAGLHASARRPASAHASSGTDLRR